MLRKILNLKKKIALNLPVGSGQKVTLIATDIDQIVDNDNRYGTSKKKKLKKKVNTT